MSDPDVYSGPGQIYLGATPVLEAQMIDVSLATGNNTVKTLRKGRAGHSKGSREYTIKVDSAIPRSGVEVDWEAIAEAGEPIEIHVVLAGKTRTYTGDIRDVSLSTNTDSPNKISWTMSASKKSTSS